MQASRYLDVEGGDGTLRVSWGRAVRMHLGLRLREAELRRLLTRHLRPPGGTKAAIESHELLVTSAALRTATVDQLPARLDPIIDTLARSPLSPRLVERALGITGRERIRWAKDGRLPRAGTTSIRRGQVITLHMHPVDAIAALEADPLTIAAWRAADSAS